MTRAAGNSSLQRDAWRPASLKFAGISIPTSDIARSKRFLLEVLGGELVEDAPRVRVHFGNFDLVLGQQEGGATDPDREYPHYAFTVPADQFGSLKRRLEAFAIPTHDPWTRTGETHSLMYFRDPSGNQYEMFCPEGDTGLELRVGHQAGGDYVVPFSSLVYDDLDTAAEGVHQVPGATPLEFNHMTLPTRDVGESKRFFGEVLGGEVTIDLPNHVTVILGGFELGYGGPVDGGWPDPEMLYPHYTFGIDPGELAPLRERLAAFGVPTSRVGPPDDAEASVYFRDPSGNLYRVLGDPGLGGPAHRGPRAGADEVPELASLSYQIWGDPGR